MHKSKSSENRSWYNERMNERPSFMVASSTNSKRVRGEVNDVFTFSWASLWYFSNEIENPCSYVCVFMLLMYMRECDARSSLLSPHSLCANDVVYDVVAAYCNFVHVIIVMRISFI